MLNALASGQIVRTPKHGTSASGTRWANTTIRCSTGTDKEGAALAAFITVVCFGDVADTLAKMGQGDAISVQGGLKQTEYTRDDGEVRHGLEVVAQAILTPYAIKQKRGDQAKANQAHALNSGEAYLKRDSNSDREKAQAYDQFAKRARHGVADFDDPIGF